MIALGASDALRGIFTPVFETHFNLTPTKLSFIITVSYIGNLFFLLIGGALTDRFKKKQVSLIVLLIWMTSLLLYVITDNYYCLLLGMFFSVGTSTLMNTIINITTPLIFLGMPATVVNTLFFTQGIGTTLSQKAAGSLANGVLSWKIVNFILIILGVLGFILLFFSYIPENNTSGEEIGIKENIGLKFITGNKTFLYLVFILGFYFIAEHGILNWMVTYCTKELGFESKFSATYLSIFFGGITVGRLVWAPFVSKLGIHKSITLFGGVGTVLYCIGIIFGKNAIMLLSISGLFLSVLYPTLILMIREYYKPQALATATGVIISTATIFDICFNAVFGKFISLFGFGKSFLILPLCMVLFYVIFIYFQIKAKN